MLFPAFFLAVWLSHWALLRLPYFWDEAGYYIPAAFDLFRTGSLIPYSTLTNAHPPLPALLLSGWWHIFGFHILATRTLVCLVSAAALLAVYRLARNLLGTYAAGAISLLTALYPVWFAQSSLAHADIFAAAFTLWAISFYLERGESAYAGEWQPRLVYRRRIYAAALFSLAALAKETAIVTPLALAAWEFFLLLRDRRPGLQRAHLGWMAALIAPIVPLAGWYAYHRARTGFIFGNPEFLRYNATANLDAQRILLSLWHRLIHLTLHMDLFVPTLCTLAILFVPRLPSAGRRAIPRPVFAALGVILLANTLAFSLLGGALLTRYLLPMYPLVLLLCVAEWQSRLQPARCAGLAALSAVAFLSALWINPPYGFAPEDNLTYRDMVVLHQRAIRVLKQRYPKATVLTAWPASSELERPELGYTATPFKVAAIPNFSYDVIQKAATDPGAYDTALLFSTKWTPPPGAFDLGRASQASNTKYFDFHSDLRPVAAAALLHGDVVWQASSKGEWVAILRFPRVFDAAVVPLRRFQTAR
ncbi:MAG TPA: glycosyltransferase family 39 protein [Granulicella sp.]|jgi:4-amino-4-deoxy-L-arabinose transferase-like glycosyltransferase|nr:glycosyltransferase family 39 protein [Granulicella sp.]